MRDIQHFFFIYLTLGSARLTDDAIYAQRQHDATCAPLCPDFSRRVLRLSLQHQRWTRSRPTRQPSATHRSEHTSLCQTEQTPPAQSPIANEIWSANAEPLSLMSSIGKLKLCPCLYILDDFWQPTANKYCNKTRKQGRAKTDTDK
jgi:hypothetical protein